MRLFLGFILILVHGCHTQAADNEPPRTDYEFVAASSTGTLGPVGGSGDILERLVITPSSLAIGTVAIQDGTLGAINVTASNGTLDSLAPISVDLGVRSVNGPWKVITPAGATVLGIGRFK